MSAIVKVTEAQREAARLRVQRAQRAGRPIRPAVLAIASAPSSVGMSSGPSGRWLGRRRRTTD